MNRCHSHLANLIADAILEGLTEVYVDGEVIPLPKCQSCGTAYQRESYAASKAIEIIEKLNKKK